MLNAIFWILHTGAPWRDLPERFGKWKTVYNSFSRWRKAGVFERILEALQIRLDREGRIDWALWCVDGTHIRASRAAAGAEKKVSGATRMNRPTTHWVAAEAGLDRSSTWLLTATAFRCPSLSPAHFLQLFLIISGPIFGEHINYRRTEFARVFTALHGHLSEEYVTGRLG